MTDDAATFNGFRGVTAPAEDFHFVFSPVAVRVTSRSNSAGFSADNTVTDKSSVSFSASHNLLDYGHRRGVNGILSNQQRVSGGATYNRRTTKYYTWSVE